MADVTEFFIDGENAGLRLDIAIKNNLPDHSRSLYQKMIKDGKVKVDGETVTVPKHTVEEGSQIEVTWPELASSFLKGEDIGLDILFEDEHMLVINKPPGMVVHPGAGNTSGTLVNALLNYDEGFQKTVADEHRPGIVHRLDKDTSGVLVIGKNENAVAKLSASFQKRDTRKLYLAIVHGFMEEPQGKMDNLIGRCRFNRKKMAIVERNGKEARSRYQVIAYNQNTSLVKVGIETGRTHQIRVHMSSIKHPIVGDEMYGGRVALRHLDAPRQMLHAWRLRVPHPVTGKNMKFEAPLPDDFIETLSKVEIKLLSRDEYLEKQRNEIASDEGEEPGYGDEMCFYVR